MRSSVLLQEAVPGQWDSSVAIGFPQMAEVGAVRPSQGLRPEPARRCFGLVLLVQAELRDTSGSKVSLSLGSLGTLG